MIADWLRVHRRALAAFAGLLAAAFMFRGVLSMLIVLCLGGAALAFVMLPLVKLLSRRMKRTAAILTAFGCVALLIIGAVFMIVRACRGLFRRGRIDRRPEPASGSGIGHDKHTP